MIYLLVRIKARRSRHNHENELQIRVDSSSVGTNILFARNMKNLKGYYCPGIFTILLVFLALVDVVGIFCVMHG
jgi:hypothetical protein